MNELRKSAEQGDAEAQYRLGLAYSMGYGVEKNDVEAVKWFLKSAEQGNAQAQNILGVCYAIGRGVERNYEVAVRWFLKSAN